MKLRILPAFGVAAVTAVGMAAFAQTTEQAPAQPAPRTQTAAPAPQTGSAAGQTVTVVGCIQREEDYRKAQNLGKGGAAGSGVGVGNEFVLANATMAGAGAASGAAGGATGTTGAAGSAYELTGPNEGKVSQFAGKRVEITGMLKPAETSGGAPTGGPTAGAPPRGVDVTSSDLKLRELEVTSVKEATGACPAR